MLIWYQSKELGNLGPFFDALLLSLLLFKLFSLFVLNAVDDAANDAYQNEDNKSDAGNDYGSSVVRVLGV